MKKTIITSLILALTITVSAQSAKIRFGLKAGLNTSAINTNLQGAQVSSLHSFYAGAGAVFPVSKHFTIQSELIYSGEGTKATGNKIEMNFIRLPFLFQYEHSSGLHVEAGPQLGYMITNKASNLESKEEIDIKDQLSNVSTSIAIGFGYRMKNGLGIDFRYSKSIDQPIGASDAKLVVASGGLSFLF